MLKDKEKRKQASKDRQRKHRQGVTMGVTKQGVTGEGVTRIEFIKEELNNDLLIKGIEAAALRFNDREARYERAYRYFRWSNGEVIEPAMAFALVYDRDRLEKAQGSLKAHNVDELVRYGVAGPTFDVIGELLDITKVAR